MAVCVTAVEAFWVDVSQDVEIQNLMKVMEHAIMEEYLAFCHIAESWRGEHTAIGR